MINMIFFYSTCVAAYVSTSFLQESTSSGTLGEGISTLSSEITGFSENLDKSLKDLDNSIDNSISLSSSVAVKLIEGETGSLGIELKEVRQNIDDLEERLAKSSQVCQVIDSCGPCVDCDNCGWCNSRTVCLPGDKNGPYAEECEDWYYQKCEFKDCSVYKSCVECMGTGSCGWCELGFKCLKDHSSCSIAFYITSSKSCPVTTSSTTHSTKYYNNYLTEDLNTLQSQEAYIQGLIENLDKDKVDMLDSAISGQSIQVNEVSIFEDLSGLKSTIDELYTSEVKSGQSYREEIGDASKSEVKSKNEENMNQSTEKMIERINKNYGEVIEGVDSMESTLGNEIEYVDNELINIANALKTSKSKSK
jgi:hypothetical protein